MSIDPSAPVNVLADRFWESLLELLPTTATMYGDDRYDDRLEDPGPEGRARARALSEATLAEAAAISLDGLSVEDRITLDMLRIVNELAVEQDDQRADLFKVVDQIAGPQTVLAQVAQFQPADTPERLERLLTRIRAYGPYMDANIELLREGTARGLTASRVATERTIAQLERLLAAPIRAQLLPPHVGRLTDGGALGPLVE